MGMHLNATTESVAKLRRGEVSLGLLDERGVRLDQIDGVKEWAQKLIGNPSNPGSNI